jgi:hypothetical protein
MRKRCKRKVWSTEINPIAHAIAGAAIVDTKTLNNLRLNELSAIASMKAGTGTLSEWKVLSDMMNVAETMSLEGIGIEVLEVCKAVQGELEAAALRYQKTKKMGLTGTGIRALQELHEYHDLQRTSVCRSVFEQMIQKTRNHILSNSNRVKELA